MWLSWVRRVSFLPNQLLLLTYLLQGAQKKSFLHQLCITYDQDCIGIGLSDKKAQTVKYCHLDHKGTIHKLQNCSVGMFF